MKQEQIDIVGLRAGISGKVFEAGDDEYDSIRAVWNNMIDHHPALIVQCQDNSDVIRSVRFAATKNLSISIKAGGHNVAGHGVGEKSLLIDLSVMNSVKVDPDRCIANVQGGCIWADVDSETQKYGLATPGGLISDTGVAGLTLSGGIGWLRGKHGLCIDNLLSVDVITANG